MEKEKKQKINFKLVLKILFKKVKIWQLLLLAVLITANTFAWFIYASEVSNSIDVHVRSWQILFKNSEEQNVNYVSFTVDSMYPGMVDQENTLNVINDGDISATITYTLLEARLFNDEFITTAGRAEREEDEQEGDLTSQELEQLLKTNYPFSINLGLTKSNLQAGYDTAQYVFTLTWPYESGDDDADTYWGNLAYTYKEAHPDTSCISLKIKVVAIQDHI